jgi:hypothetical protein
MKTVFFLAAALLTVFLAGCQSGGALRTITEGDQLAFYDFSDPGTFEEGSYGDARLRILNNTYRFEIESGNGEVWWGQWGESYGDVIISVEAEQVTERAETAYGVMCRVRGTVGQEVAAEDALGTVDEDATVEPTAESPPDDAATEEATAEPEPRYGEGDGYLFLVQGSGAYGIFRATARNLTPLVDWTISDVIDTAPGLNRLRAVCIGDYLALYVNDQLLAQAFDTSYREGQVGLAASASNRLGVRVQFDNLTVRAGS